MARKFFYACAGLALLVTAFQIGAGTVSAQSGTELEALGFANGVSCNGLVVVDSQGRVFTDCGGTPWHQVAQLPGAGAAIHAEGNFGRDVWVGLKNGDIYHCIAGEWSFTLVGNALGGLPINAIKGSWGSLKARYR